MLRATGPWKIALTRDVLAFYHEKFDYSQQQMAGLNNCWWNKKLIGFLYLENLILKFSSFLLHQWNNIQHLQKLIKILLVFKHG